MDEGKGGKKKSGIFADIISGCPLVQPPTPNKLDAVKVGRPRTTTKIKISYDDGPGKKRGQESRTVQTAAVPEAAAAAANRSLEETWRRRELKPIKDM